MTSDLERSHNFKLVDARQIASSAWIAPNATVVGDVTLGDESSIWFNCVLRGDLAPIRIGKQSNVQDGCILHVGAEFPCTLGDRVSLGHGAIVHGATIEDDCLIGMRATVLNGAVVGKGSIVGAGAVVPEKMVIPPGSLVLGLPAKVVKSLAREHAETIAGTAKAYVGYARGYKASFAEENRRRADF